MRVPWRRSLVVRLFLAVAAIVLLAVAATTWATVNATSVALSEDRRDSLHADARAYDELLEHAATHRSWRGAARLVAELSEEIGGPVTVTDLEGQVLADSERRTGVRDPADARATLDALDVDAVLRDTLRSTLPPEDDVVAVPAECASGTACRLSVVPASGLIDGRVRGPFAAGGDVAAWRDLERRIDRCLDAAGLPDAVAVREDFAVLVPFDRAAPTVARCADQSRRAVLTPYVAPPALLFVGDEAAPPEVLWDLSRDSQVRVGLLAGGVLAATLLLCALLAGSVVRPLRRMTATAQRAGDGDLSARVSEGRRDEVGVLAAAFNRMAARREADHDARVRLTSDVSHELRTPLANVRGWLEAAQDGLVETDRALVDSLHDETVLLQRLVDDLRDLAVGDAGGLVLNREVLDLDAFLAMVARSFRPAAEAGGVTLFVTAEPDATAYADPVRLRQAVGNLVANALQHTPSGGTVRVHGAPDSVAVADTGHGIPADDLPHVFDRFRRVDPSRNRATGGSGLGLAIVRQIIDAHGGAVRLDSKSGTGTTAVVTLPAAR
ncbi:HAMP domain-containing sensor histidine kinase [Nocardioides sp. C4-1]|uniref:sensor histidine kinase n=1 Tax=Nocardioides sp. C4-1 TaxID=3151851 RepID=UPI0032644447